MTSASRQRAAGRLRPPADDGSTGAGYDSTDDRWDDRPSGGGPSGRGPAPLRGRRVLLAAGLALVLVVAAVYAVAFSPLFGVRTVDVRGTHLLSAAQVRSAAHIDHGTPLVRLDTGAVRTRVERLPDVGSARVSTSFPSTVVITVVERQAVGYVRAGSAYGLIDATGLQYRTVAARPAALPMFVLPSGAAARSTGAAVGTVAAALPAALRAKVTSIQALDAGAISLQLKGGVLVQWGSAARSRDKAQLIPTLLKGGPQLIDVSNPDVPFTR